MQKCLRKGEDWKVGKGEKLCLRSRGAMGCDGAQLLSCFFLGQCQRTALYNKKKILTRHFVLLWVEESLEDIFKDLIFLCESVQHQKWLGTSWLLRMAVLSVGNWEDKVSFLKTRAGLYERNQSSKNFY